MVGCGLDKLEWSKVRKLISDAFQGIDIEIKVYTMEGPSNTKEGKKSMEYNKDEIHASKSKAEIILIPKSNFIYIYLK